MTPEHVDLLRMVTAWTGVVAAGLMSWRLIACWMDTTVLVHVLGLLLIGSVVISALGTSVAASNDAPYNPVLWAVLAHRLACIGVAIMWPHWLARTDPPYRRPLI